MSLKVSIAFTIVWSIYENQSCPFPVGISTFSLHPATPDYPELAEDRG